MENKTYLRFILIFLIILFGMLPQSLMGEDYSLVNLDIEAFSASLFGELGSLSSGVYLDMYFGIPVLIHLGLSYCYPIGYTGFIPEAGLGIIIANSFSRKDYTILIYLGRDYNEFGQEVDTYQVNRGTCYAAEMHIIEAGSFAYLLKEEHY